MGAREFSRAKNKEDFTDEVSHAVVKVVDPNADTATDPDEPSLQTPDSDLSGKIAGTLRCVWCLGLILNQYNSHCIFYHNSVGPRARRGGSRRSFNLLLYQPLRMHMSSRQPCATPCARGGWPFQPAPPVATFRQKSESAPSPGRAASERLGD